MDGRRTSEEIVKKISGENSIFSVQIWATIVATLELGL